MRRAARVDANQAHIVADLRAMGCTVQPLHGVGGGCPDLLVGYRGLNCLVEVKDGSLPPSRRRLTDDQLEWHRDWRGQKVVAVSSEDAMTAVDRHWRETKGERQ